MVEKLVFLALFVDCKEIKEMDGLSQNKSQFVEGGQETLTK